MGIQIQQDDLFDPVAYINTPRWLKVSLGLHRTQELLSALENPQDKLSFVHVAGTNGKGSTCAFTAQILQEAGYKVGLFTSPYLICFEERIRVNGQNIPMDRLREVTLKVRDVAESMEEHPTEFELMTAVAFEYFAQENCDIVVAEVGLGGRLDSTNVINPLVCGIAPIALDHTGVLGETLEEIAAEKAGIIKENTPVVSAFQPDQVAAVLKEKAKSANAPLATINQQSIQGTPAAFSYISNRGLGYQDICLSLLGSYQIYNAALAIELSETLNQCGLTISQQAIIDGLSNTAWPGRFERVCVNPDIIIDGGHNVQGAQALVDSLNQVYPGKKINFIFGVLEDKQYQEMIEILLPFAKHFVCFTPPNPRACQADKLSSCIEETSQRMGCSNGSISEVSSSIEEAVSTVSRDKESADVFCFCGSLYSIGEIKQKLASLGYTTSL